MKDLQYFGSYRTSHELIFLNVLIDCREQKILDWIFYPEV
jgi:hypothetical protein